MSCSPKCGNGIIEPPEQCDDANEVSGDECDHCTIRSIARCGDGIVAGVEECDDRNTMDGDGCSADCRVESGFSCAGQPSVCMKPEDRCHARPGFVLNCCDCTKDSAGQP